MAEPMTTFASRRIRNIILFAIALAVIAFATAVDRVTVTLDGFFTGWILFGLFVFLAGLNIRAKLSMLPIGNASTWTQLHIYAGLMTVFVFLMHIDWSIPNGIFEWTVAGVFTLTVLSGIIGLFLSRIVPRQLTRRGEEVMFERIPSFRAKLREEAEAVILRAAEAGGGNSIRAFYLEKLAEFFAGPRNFMAHMTGSTKPIFTLKNEMESLERYLGPTDRAHLDELRALVIRKDDLDFHHAQQLVLKTWTFVHVPMTWALLIVMLLHMTMAYAFSGGMP